MKVTSKLLGIEIPVTEYEENGKPLYIIAHDTIDRILLKYPRISIRVRPSMISENRCVVECWATDEETQTSIFKVGESCLATLTTKISQEYRATLSYQRAIDRAVIALLQVDAKKCFSSLEIDTRGKKLCESAPGVQTGLQSKTAGEDVPAVQTEELPAKAGERTVLDVPDADHIPDDLVILIGSCRGKTYGRVKETDVFEAFLRYIGKNDVCYPDEVMNAQAALFQTLAKKKGF